MNWRHEKASNSPPEPNGHQIPFFCCTFRLLPISLLSEAKRSSCLFISALNLLDKTRRILPRSCQSSSQDSPARSFFFTFELTLIPINSCTSAAALDLSNLSSKRSVRARPWRLRSHDNSNCLPITARRNQRVRAKKGAHRRDWFPALRSSEFRSSQPTQERQSECQTRFPGCSRVSCRLAQFAIC